MRAISSAGRRILEERYNLEDALVVATFLNTFVNNAHIIKIANMAENSFESTVVKTVQRSARAEKERPSLHLPSAL